MAAYRDNQPQLDRSDFDERLSSFKSLGPAERCVCTTCGVICAATDLEAHSDHGVQSGVSEGELSKPTRLLMPVDNKKSQAQFFFSDSSCQLILSELQRLEYSHVLCIGTPRLHETLLNSNVKSLLLDVDHRYAQFYSSSQYLQYNMFNNFFYEPTGLDTCRHFISAQPDSLAIVVDPPFGGLVQVLAHSIRKLWNVAGKELPTFLVFPYFMESHMLAALPSLRMMDYQVTYANHKHFSSERKKPSPVRVFTNLPPPGLQLPASEGYWLCATCNSYSAQGNAHCLDCGACTSKDGRHYSHCEQCGVCVKPGRVHCSVCHKCELPVHHCGPSVRAGCHVCGSLEHKRRDCPEKVVQQSKQQGVALRKRKRVSKQASNSRKKRSRKS